MREEVAPEGGVVGAGEAGGSVATVSVAGGAVNVAVGVLVGLNVALGCGDALYVEMAVLVSFAGWKGVTVAAFGSYVGRRNCAKGSGVGTGVGAAQAASSAARIA